jgi:hypothetical protein
LPEGASEERTTDPSARVTTPDRPLVPSSPAVPSDATAPAPAELAERTTEPMSEPAGKSEPKPQEPRAGSNPGTGKKKKPKR